MTLLSMLFFGAACRSSSKDKKETPDTDDIETDADSDTEEPTEEPTDEPTEPTEPTDDEPTEPEDKPLTDEDKLESIKNLAEEYLHFAHGTGVVVGYGYDKLTTQKRSLRQTIFLK